MVANTEASISVIIPAYNAEQTLGRALDSVLRQTRPADEILIIDDFSSDSTVALARTYVDRGISVVCQRKRTGAAAARNVGIEVSSGNWVAFLDADDEWLPEKLEKQAAAITLHPEASLVFCASEEFSADGKSLGDTFRGLPVEISQNAWKALLARNFVATPTVVAPRELLLELGGFDETLKVAEDQDMWIRLALSGSLAYVPERLVRVYVQAESLSSWKVGDQTEYTLPMIERHIAALRDQLTKQDVRAIRGARLQNAGLINCAHGDLKRGLSQLMRSAFLGCRPFRALKAMLVAAVRRFCSRLHFVRSDGHTAT